MSSLLSAEISATCNALGYLDEKNNKYYADDNTLETVKDLIRYLRRDDEIHTIRRQLGETKVLITDLLPLLKNYHEENDLFDVLLRLIMNLTTPPLLLFNFEIPTDKLIRNYYLQLEDNLKSYKEAFVDEGIWAVFSTHMSKIFEVDSAERGEESSVKIERILVLIRNILFVPADSLEKRPDNDASIHDQVLWALHHSGLLDIILYITTNPAEQAYYMYILEIMFFMLKGQQPNELANAALQRSQGEKVRDEAELVNIRHSESNQKQKKMKVYMGARHSRFGGTFIVKNLKSITDNELISHKPLNKLDAFDFDASKRKLKIPKNRRPVVSNTVDRRSAFTIRLFLKEFCIEFLNGAYNSMMQYVKSILVRSDGDKHDESYYLWAVSFFMAFNRYYKFEVKLVSETLSVQTFYYVQQQSENYLDLIKKDRKKFLVWSTRLHTALLSYKELLSTLFIMDKSSDQVIKDSSKVIKSNVFYITEYREFVLSLLIMYDEIKMSNHYLKDLMETQHLFLKMFEAYCKEEGCIVVKKISKSKKKKTKSTKKNDAPTELDLDEMWDKVSPQLSVILEAGGDFLTEYVPFDAASDTPIEEQKSIAMNKIQHQLRNADYEGAIGIMRAAREVWPENNSFGSNNMTSEEEFLSLREVFYADLGDNLIENVNRDEDNYYDNDEQEEDDEEENFSRNEEVNFSFKDFLQRLPHPKIIRTCGLALRYFETNSVNTNHSILKLMHRIAFDCKSYVMMFQLSLFRTFQKIFRVKDLPQYRELVKFAIYILRQFFKLIETNNKLYIEILFWTQKKDAYEIEYGYGSFENVIALWSEEEVNELRVLFEEYQNKQIDEDVVDWILKNLISQTRTRRMVLVKLKAMDLLEGYKKPKGNVRRTNSVFWTTEEETLLRELHVEFKDSPDPLGSIMHGIRFTRPKNKVIDKMLTLGLIDDKNELKKKRKNVKKGNRKSLTAREDNFSSSDSDSDSQPTATASVPVKIKNSQKKKKPPAISADNKVINTILLENVKAGRQAALGWLKESIDDVIDDFEEDHDGIPLVPLADYAEDAMETGEFKKFLLSLGFTEPFDEQECYWRIPGHISIDTLKSHSGLIMSALENNINDITDLSENDISQGNGRTISPVVNETTCDNVNDELNNEINDNLSSVNNPKFDNDNHPTISITEETNDCDDNSVSKRHRSISESDSPPGKRSKTDNN